jgi:catechol 2,3-dioxygenase-like lactoylglutathione lyase family enzyme
MKRFHVHVSVNDLQQNIAFYSSIFGAQPTVEKPDYAKWMLDDPRVNFAISTRGHAFGVNHLGIQAESDGELKALRTGIVAAQAPLLEQKETSCCYVKSDKYWTTDPQGIAWETFHTLGDVPVYGEDEGAAQASVTAAPKAAACCAPKAA